MKSGNTSDLVQQLTEETDLRSGESTVTEGKEKGQEQNPLVGALNQ